MRSDERDDAMYTELAADSPDTRFDFIHIMPSMTTLEVDLFLSVQEDEPCSWNPDEVFASAMDGIFDALVPALSLADSHGFVDGDLDFARDLECRAPLIDRHGSYLMDKKAKERASNAFGRNFKSSLYGGSRNPSRASSRTHSRVAAALTTSVMAMKMARLAFEKPTPSIPHGDAPFRINEWSESESEAGISKPGAHSFDPSAGAMSSRFSLASSPESARTSRMTVDHQEIRRRDEITRDISTREGRQKLTARIQRKGELKLKLRSMADPTVSFDREEYEALKKNRGALMSQGSPTVATNSVTDRPAMPRIGSIIGGNSLGTTTSRSNEPTYRPEDYEGLNSEVVTVDKKGELLLGENCNLMVRKPRRELQHDMLQRNTVKPRIHFADHEPESDEEVSSSAPSQTEDSRSISRLSPNRAVSPQSVARGANVPEPNSVFEGHCGTIQPYPKIELDPKKTPLSKGVKIKPPKPQESVALPAAPSALRDIVNPVSHGKPNHAVPHHDTKPTLSEDQPTDPIESQMQVLIRSTDNTKQPSATGSSISPHRVLPIKSRLGENQHLQSLRLRTPAYGNRKSRGGTAVLGISLGEIFDDECASFHHAADPTASLQTPNKRPGAASLPKFKVGTYLREFPSTSKGLVHVISATAAVTLVSSPTTKSTSPFSPLPSVVRGTR